MAGEEYIGPNFLAMKVLSGECYRAGTDIFELEILQLLGKTNKDHPSG